MNNINKRIYLVCLIATATMVGCTTTEPRYAGADPVRERLNQLENNQTLAYQSPIAMEDARAAVSEAEKRQKNPGVSQHLLFMAQRKVDIAESESKRRYLEGQRATLTSQRDAMQLKARTSETRRAQMSARQATEQTQKAQLERNKAEQEVVNAKSELAEMQTQLDEMDARNDERGTVVTLGNVLFDFNKAEINTGAISHLTKLASFLNSNIHRNIIIEGHTDNIGADKFNMHLSLQRAEAVRNYLQSQGVAGDRIQVIGRGGEFPVTDNATVSKRQQNRRVEVIIDAPVG